MSMEVTAKDVPRAEYDKLVRRIQYLHEERARDRIARRVALLAILVAAYVALGSVWFWS